MSEPKPPKTPKPPTMIRVPVRIAGKLVSFRIEEPILEDIDRLARSQGMDRSRWIRHACHVQLVLDLIDNGDGREEHEPPPAPVEPTYAPVTPLEPPLPPTPPTPPVPAQPDPEVVRPNRWT